MGVFEYAQARLDIQKSLSTVRCFSGAIRKTIGALNSQRFSI